MKHNLALFITSIFPLFNIFLNIVFFSILLNIEYILKSNFIPKSNFTTILNTTIIVLAIFQILSIFINALLYYKNSKVINKNIFIILVSTQRSAYFVLVLFAPILINFINNFSALEIVRTILLVIPIYLLTRIIYMITLGIIKNKKISLMGLILSEDSLETKLAEKF